MLLLLCCYSYYLTVPHHPPCQVHEPKFYIIWLFIIFVGLGSFLFHSTLSIAGQVLDELPICLLLIFATCIATPIRNWNLTLRAELFSTTFFLCTAPALTVLCLLYPVISHIVCILSLPASTVSFLHLYFAMPVAARPVNVVRSTLCILLLSVTAWVVDRVWCSSLRALLGFDPHLHAVWHVGMAALVWGVILIGYTCRLYGDGKPSRIVRGGIGGLVPYVTLQV